MGKINFSTRAKLVKDYGTNPKIIGNNQRYPIYDFVSRTKIIKSIITGIGNLPLPLDQEIAQKKIRMVRASLSASLKVATIRETGKIRESSVDQFVSATYSRIIQAVGLNNFTALGIRREKDEDGLSYQKKVEASLKPKIKSILEKKDLISPTNALRMIKMLQAAAKLMTDLSTPSTGNPADSIISIFKVFRKGIQSVGIGNGIKAYEVDHKNGLIMGMNEEKDWEQPKGNDAQFVFINRLVSRKLSEVSSAGRTAYLSLLNRIKFWDGKWHQFGLSKKIFRDYLEAEGIKDVTSGLSGFIGKMFNSKATILAKALSDMLLDKLYLNDDQLNIHCAAVYNAFAKKHLTDETERQKFDAIYNSMLVKIKDIAKKTIKDVFDDPRAEVEGRKSRRNISYEALNSEGLLELSYLINNDFVNFSEVVKNYLDSLEIKDKHGRKNEDDLYSMIYLSTTSELVPYAMVHNYQTEESRNDKLLSNENDNILLMSAISQISDTLNMSIRMRQSEARIILDNNQKNALFQISNIMNEDSPLIERIKKLPEKLTALCRKNGEKKNATVSMITKFFDDPAETSEPGGVKDEKNEMSIIATTIIDDQTKDYQKDTISLERQYDAEGKPIPFNDLSAAVLKHKRTIFIDKGEIYSIVAPGQTIDKQDKLDMAHLPEELRGAVTALGDISEKKQSLILSPLIKGSTELGVTILSGEKLTLEDVWLLNQGNNQIVLSTTNTIQMEELVRSEAKLRKAYAALEVMAREDDLTKLLRRKPFENALDSEIEKAKQHGWPLVLMMLDLDNFKSKINDKYGHQTGDKILQEVTAEIKQFFKEQAAKAGDVDDTTSGRYGGEEITVILPRIEKGYENTGANGLGLKLLKYISSKKRFTHEGKPFEENEHRNSIGELEVVTVSIGASSYQDYLEEQKRLQDELKRTQDEKLQEEIKKRLNFTARERMTHFADQALTAVKNATKNGCWTFNLDVDVKAEEAKKKQASAKEEAKRLLREAREANIAGDYQRANELMAQAEIQMNLIR